jgi:hypothetical protein
MMIHNKQKELEITPERTPLGQKAVEYLNIREQIEGKKNELEIAKDELVQEFIKAGVETVKVENVVLTYKHLENDKITVKQAAEEI